MASEKYHELNVLLVVSCCIFVLERFFRWLSVTTGSQASIWKRPSRRIRLIQKTKNCRF